MSDETSRRHARPGDDSDAAARRGPDECPPPSADPPGPSLESGTDTCPAAPVTGPEPVPGKAAQEGTPDDGDEGDEGDDGDTADPADPIERLDRLDRIAQAERAERAEHAARTERPRHAADTEAAPPAPPAAPAGPVHPAGPDGDPGPDVTTASRKPTVENRRPVLLYHEDRHIRERIRSEETSEIPVVQDRADPPPAEGHGEDTGPAAPHAPTGPGTAPGEGPDEPSGRRRLAAAFWPPRLSRGQLVGAVLLFALGAGVAIQVRSTTESDPLRGARESDLVRVLDELGERTRRLEEEKHRLENSRSQLQSSNDRVQEAREQNEAKADALGVLAGTVKATGPGITLTITDPQGNVSADMLLDTLQELRAAGAEAVQINDVRVVAGTYFAKGRDGGIDIDGTNARPPYVFKVIGNPQDLEPALGIPGGVIRTLEKKQAGAVVTPSQEVRIDALRPAEKPGYARSAPGAGDG